jgi:cyclopropane fatty-acyl-phospholipid synthase-like methyltransferase
MDVPSPIDLRQMDDARQWAESAMVKRPWRTEFFAAFASAITTQSGNDSSRVLELGSGPGFLAEHLLTKLPAISYVALDFSAAMHELAAQRIGQLVSRVQFVEHSFREPDWSDGLGLFHHVVTNQAVHEMRHKRYAPALHAQVRECLVADGSYLVCDHFAGEGGMTNDQLYMSVAEQKAALLAAGFANVEQLLLKGGLVLHRAT